MSRLNLLPPNRRKQNESQNDNNRLPCFRLDVVGPYNRRYSDMEEYMKYIRCRYCDSSFDIEEEELKIIWLGNRQDIKHRRAEFECPACGLLNEECFVFESEDN